MSSISFKTPKLEFETQGINGHYRGDFSKDGNQISGTWEQGGLTVPLVLDRTEMPANAPGQPPAK